MIYISADLHQISTAVPVRLKCSRMEHVTFPFGAKLS